MSMLNDWFKLMRISNLPTCVSNVLVGTAIGVVSLPPEFPGPFMVPLEFLSVIVGVCCLYLGGMILNDVADAPRDRLSRPDKPIPAGRIDRRVAAVISMLLLLGGWYLCMLGAGSSGAIAAGVLVACIILYDLFHGAVLPAIALMACCRALVYVIAAFAVTPDINVELTVILALGLAIHTAMVTGIARGETGTTRPPVWPIALLPVPMCLVVLLEGSTLLNNADLLQWCMVAVTALLASLMMARIGMCLQKTPPLIIPAVLTGLSSMALIDAFYLAMLDIPVFALLAIACFALVALMHQSISGT
jgi:4-hydroxybenzoate polyprenyltransferase